MVSSNAAMRDAENSNHRTQQLRRNASSTSVARATETEEQHGNCLQLNATSTATERSAESSVTRQNRLNANSTQRGPQRGIPTISSSCWFNQAFHYNPDTQYGLFPDVQIGSISVTCTSCGAKKWPGEPPGLCCSNGKVHLPLLQDLPELLKTLMIGGTSESEHFLSYS